MTENLEVLTLEREWSLEDVTILQVNISLPKPKIKRIRRFYELQSRSFFAYCNSELYPYAVTAARNALNHSTLLPSFQAELNYYETYKNSKLWSLYTQSRETTTQSFLRRWGDTWNLSTGYPVPLSTFFPPHAHWRQLLLTTASREIEIMEKRGIARYYNNWRQLLRHNLNARNFYLTASGLIFFFPMCVIAPAMEGIPAFLIPYDEEKGPRIPEEYLEIS